MIPPFQTTFAVPLSCESCIKDLSTSLYKIDAPPLLAAPPNRHHHRHHPPTLILRAIHSTGRDAILRGSGAPNSAAVCILETHAPSAERVRGLARMVQVAPGLTVVDLTVRGLKEGTYWATVRETGDVSRGAASVGAVWGEVVEAAEGRPRQRMRKGVLGTLEVSKAGVGSVFVDRPVQVWEMIGRSMVVSKVAPPREGGAKEAFEAEDPDTVVGVIARSAGVWENDKTVCSCSGKTVWEEREEQRGKGML
ncbi:MAG: superoxide dismutase copper chaperone [Lasallia pustulata]|uniref:Superoxide dismutase copper chaperone n=1 Tax=Lasallia pustulata TaxID=136370 RepID=A0A5M8PSE0_9LECA|nr:MAG: superoxide dismutase copper chaperone [Lasallia pustulata]